MSVFTLDFVLEDDLDESLDAIPPQESAAVPSIDNTLVSFQARTEERYLRRKSHFCVGPGQIFCSFIFGPPLCNLI